MLLTKKIFKTVFGNRPMVSLWGPHGDFGTATHLCPGVPSLAERQPLDACEDSMAVFGTATLLCPI